MRPPAENEYAPFYAGYVRLVAGDDILQTLGSQAAQLRSLLNSFGEERATTHRYAAGKWTPKEVVGHITDGERVFAYRAMRFARNDSTELAGFDENAFVAAGAFNSRELSGLLDEFAHLRAATVALFSSLNDEQLSLSGVANGQRITVRALGYILAGHAAHHMKLLRERYA